MINYCSRCGSLKCTGHCDTLNFFSEVVTLWPFDSEQGQIIYGMKRNNSSRDKIIFYQYLLPQILIQIRLMICKHLASQLIIAPMSSSSWKAFPMQNCIHPNLIIAQQLAKILGSKTDPARESLEQIVYGFKNCPSTSLIRRAKKNSAQNAQAHWNSEFWQSSNLTTIQFKSPNRCNPFSQSPCSKNQETFVFFDDVLSTGYTAARIATEIDPNTESNWVFIAALRTLKKENDK